MIVTFFYMFQWMITTPMDCRGGQEGQARKCKRRLQNGRMVKLDAHLEEQFAGGKLLACIASRPGQCGQADGYVQQFTCVFLLQHAQGGGCQLLASFFHICVIHRPDMLVADIFWRVMSLNSTRKRFRRRAKEQLPSYGILFDVHLLKRNRIFLGTELH